MGRMEAFSDGVFAIAITLLVLDFAIHPPGSPLHQVLHIWPSFVAYIVSFLTDRRGLARPPALTELERTDSIFLDRTCCCCWSSPSCRSQPDWSERHCANHPASGCS